MNWTDNDLTHRQFLAWSEWRYAEDWERETKLENYLARDYAAKYLTRDRERVDVRKGLMTFVRVLPAKPAAGASGGDAGSFAETATLKSGLVAAMGGAFTHRLRHPDGSVTDAKTGELISGPDPDWDVPKEQRR